MSTTSNGAAAPSPNGKRQDGYASSTASPSNATTKSKPDFPNLPPAPAPHVFGTGYSSKHKVPKAQDWTDISKSHQEQADEYARIMEARQQADEDERRINTEGPVSEDEGEPAYFEVDGDGDPIDPQDSPTAAGHKVTKNGQESKKKADPKNAPNEKQRLMDQMTSFSGACSRTLRH